MGQPLNPDAAHAAMMEKLQSKLKARATPPPADPEVKRVQLQWCAPGPGTRGYYDTTKRYTVCPVTVMGHEFWEAWKLVPGAWFRQIAVGLKTETAARAAAEADAMKT